MGNCMVKPTDQVTFCYNQNLHFNCDEFNKILIVANTNYVSYKISIAFLNPKLFLQIPQQQKSGRSILKCNVKNVPSPVKIDMKTLSSSDLDFDDNSASIMSKIIDEKYLRTD